VLQLSTKVVKSINLWPFPIVQEACPVDKHMAGIVYSAAINVNFDLI
jgi:hypothetical protein